jgi:site-specific recombinase XerD
LDKDYSLGTLKHYRTTKKRLFEFIRIRTERSDIALSKVDFSFLNSFDVFLKTEKNVMPNTALTYHKHLKKVINTAIAFGYVFHCPYDSFKPTRNETNRDFLTLQELTHIQSKKIDISRLDFIRNVFVFACYTGLSYSDIEKLSSNHIQKGSDGNDWIIIDRTKTDSRCRIPLLPAAKEVLKKYKNHPIAISKDRLLPIYSNQKMNSYLKELADICGIEKNLSMHVARHTFATSVTLSNGVPMETVSKMLGHTSLKTTQIYARIVDSKISNAIEQRFVRTRAGRHAQRVAARAVRVSDAVDVALRSPCARGIVDRSDWRLYAATDPWRRRHRSAAPTRPRARRGTAHRAAADGPRIQQLGHRCHAR